MFPPILYGSDKRWTGLYILPVSLLLILLTVIITAMTITEIAFLTDVTSLVTLSLSILTLSHSTIDVLLNLKSHLNPVYTVAMSSILFVFWLTLASWELAETILISPNPDSYYGNYLDVYEYEKVYALQKGRFAISWMVVGLYVAAIHYSAKALKRDKRRKLTSIIDERILEFHREDKLSEKD